jgi:hypothetical protein
MLTFDKQHKERGHTGKDAEELERTKKKGTARAMNVGN